MKLRKLVVGSLAALGGLTVLGTLFALVASGKSDGPGWFTPERVALLSVEGVIDSDTEFLDDLRRFREDPTVRAIVVHIDSPGGAVAPSQSIYQELRRVRDDGVPVVASIGSVGASGGYYVALAADTIIALPGSITGSIGVIMEFPNTQALLEKVGVSMEIVKSAEHKDIGSPFRGVTPGDRAVLQAMVSDVYGQFVETVEAERSLPRARPKTLADGRVFSGRQAVASGLIDRTGNLSDAIAVAGRMAGLGDDPEVVTPPEPEPSLLDYVLGGRASALAERLQAGATHLEGPRVRYIAR